MQYIVPCVSPLNVIDVPVIPDTFDAPDGGFVLVPLLVEYHTVQVIPDPDTGVHETVKDGDPPDTPLVTVTPLTSGGCGVGDGIADVATMYRGRMQKACNINYKFKILSRMYKCLVSS